MIAVGLPTIAETIGVPLTHASWVVTIYLIVMAAVQPIAGKMGDLFGRKTMFLLGISFFLAASVACMFSRNLLTLVLFRALQAIGGAVASPNASALIREVVPKEKLGPVFGTFGLLMGLGAAIGPLVGSLLIGLWGWTSIFWINIPFAVFSLLAAYWYLPASRINAGASLDIKGSVYLTASLTVLILAITHPEFMNVWTAILFAATVGLFIRQELRCKEPVIQFSLFKNMEFSSANASILLSNAVMYSTILVMPVWLQKMYHFSVQNVGVLLFLFSAAMSASSWLGGLLTQKLGSRRLILLSFLVSAVALLGYLGIYRYPVQPYIAAVLLIGGIGGGIGMPSMQTASLQSVPKTMSGVASGIFSTSRYIGGMIASVLVSLLADSHSLFYSLLILAVLGFPAASGAGTAAGRAASAEKPSA
ncbi:MFS transporter [Paenibacillus thalictri]|uniref:MFS transporter n=2 Tax=Paenibacillus thalictri TaxID=2527873 RepID=A0A4Q9DKD5_9BACL|nr:MFS transporter [Paenibacillus thalictri]